MDAGVKGLDPPVHHLREAGEVGHVLDDKAGLGERAPRAAGRDEGDAALGERTREGHEAGLVRHGEERARDAFQVARHRGSGGGKGARYHESRAGKTGPPLPATRGEADSAEPSG